MQALITHLQSKKTKFRVGAFSLPSNSFPKGISLKVH